MITKTIIFIVNAQFCAQCTKRRVHKCFFCNFYIYIYMYIHMIHMHTIYTYIYIYRESYIYIYIYKNIYIYIYIYHKCVICKCHKNSIYIINNLYKYETTHTSNEFFFSQCLFRLECLSFDFRSGPFKHEQLIKKAD